MTSVSICSSGEEHNVGFRDKNLGEMHGSGDGRISSYLTLREEDGSERQNVDETRRLKHNDFVEFAVQNRNVKASVKQMFPTLVRWNCTPYTK